MFDISHRYVSLFVSWCYRWRRFEHQQLWASLRNLRCFTCDLVILTFDLQTSKWSHRSLSLLPVNFQLAVPFRSRLSARHGTDNKRTDIRQTTLNATSPYGPGIKQKRTKNTL